MDGNGSHRFTRNSTCHNVQRNDRTRVVLDSIAGLGEFVEVETEAHEEEIDAAREEVAGMIESLGLNPDAEIRTSYLELLLGDGD